MCSLKAATHICSAKICYIQRQLLTSVQQKYVWFKSFSYLFSKILWFKSSYSHLFSKNVCGSKADTNICSAKICVVQMQILAFV